MLRFTAGATPDTLHRVCSRDEVVACRGGPPLGLNFQKGALSSAQYVERPAVGAEFHRRGIGVHREFPFDRMSNGVDEQDPVCIEAAHEQEIQCSTGPFIIAGPFWTAIESTIAPRARSKTEIRLLWKLLT